MNETEFKINGRELTITRTFNASKALVWRAWTEAELLDQWWAPKPWMSETSHMEFKEGGHRIYAMVSPEGEKHMARTDYTSINAIDSFAGKDSFCDADGKVKPAMPVATFTNTFDEQSGKTQVSVVTQYDSEEQVKQVIEMGLKEGLSMAYQNLDKVLLDLNK